MQHTLQEQSDPVLYTPPTTLLTGASEGISLYLDDPDDLKGVWLSESGLYGLSAEPPQSSPSTWDSQPSTYDPQIWSTYSPVAGLLAPALDSTPLEIKAMKAYQGYSLTPSISPTAIPPWTSPEVSSFPAHKVPITIKTEPSELDGTDGQVDNSPTSSIASSSSSSRRRRSTMELSLEDDDDFASTMAVERNGMMWGMKVADYRALSAKDRKRTRNRISARHFRLRRKKHYDSLAKDLGGKDEMLEKVEQETARLKLEVARLRERIAMYEGRDIKPRIL